MKLIQFILFIFIQITLSRSTYYLGDIKIVGIISHKTHRKYTLKELFPCTHIEDNLFLSYSKPKPITPLSQKDECKGINTNKYIQMIEDNVWLYFDIDGKMVTSFVDEKKEHQVLGIPIGYKEENKYYLHNVFHFDLFLHDFDISNIMITPFSANEKAITSQQQSNKNNRFELKKNEIIRPVFYYSYLQIDEELNGEKKYVDSAFMKSLKINIHIILAIVIILALVFNRFTRIYKHQTNEFVVGMTVNGLSLLLSLCIEFFFMLFSNEMSFNSFSEIFFIIYLVVLPICFLIYELFTIQKYDGLKLFFAIIIPQTFVQLLYFANDLLQKEEEFKILDNFSHYIRLCIHIIITYPLIGLIVYKNNQGYQQPIHIKTTPFFNRNGITNIHAIYVILCSLIMAVVRNYLLQFVLIYPMQEFFFNFFSCCALYIVSCVIVIVLDEIIHKAIDCKNQLFLTVYFELCTFILTIVLSFMSIDSYSITLLIQTIVIGLIFFMIDFHIIHLFNY